MKVLVTGSEPYHPWQRNPSGETARHLDGATIVDAEITGLVLPGHSLIKEVMKPPGFLAHPIVTPGLFPCYSLDRIHISQPAVAGS